MLIPIFKIFFYTCIYTLRQIGAKQKKRIQLKKEWAELILKTLQVKLEITGAAPTPGSMIVVGNHISYLDIPVLMAAYPEITFIAKSDLRKWPIIGFAAAAVGTIFVQRAKSSDRTGARQQIVKVLKEKKSSVAIFPSGTTTLFEQSLWKRGAFEIAEQAEVPVQLFRIDYDPLRVCAYVDDDNFLFSLSALSKVENKKVTLRWLDQYKRIQDPAFFSEQLRTVVQNHSFRNQKKSFALLGVCSGLGQKHQGVEFAPRVLRECGICDIFTSEEIDFLDLGDIYPLQKEDVYGWDLIARLRDKAFCALQDQQVLFTLGGDHSISIGTIQATLLAYPRARVVWVDAHGDMNTPETSLSGQLHGMPLAALLGLFKTPIGGPILKPDQLLIVGVRDLDPAEKVFFDELNINFITSNEIHLSPDKVLQKVSAWLAADLNSPVHLSFDIDALDPEFAPATGILVPSGLSIDFSKSLVRLIASTQQIVSMDLVEFNSSKVDTDFGLQQTVQSAKSVLMSALDVR